MSEYSTSTTPRIAIIGAGISGLGCAWQINKELPNAALTIFEAAAKAGGHTNTIDITVDGITHPIDTGFLVFNRRTYPNLIQLFAELDVPIAESDMSFSVSHPDLEWAGTDLNTLFAQRRNLLRPAFWRMLRDLMRFNKQTTQLAQNGQYPDLTLGEFLEVHGYSHMLRDWYLLPMAGAIWSCSATQMLDYPIATFIRFCHNHGLLQITDRPQWYTVRGGGREYVQRLLQKLHARVLCNQPIQQIRRIANGWEMHSAKGSEVFDAVVLACHSDQALQILAEPTAQEAAILSAIRYQPNTAFVHTDPHLLPRQPRAWAAWNYLQQSPAQNTPSAAADSRRMCVTYLINRLQPVPFQRPILVTLNPVVAPQATHTLAKIDYAHPIFDSAAIAAQTLLPSIQGQRGLWFCGAWAGYGFHEDGLTSGLHVARQLATQQTLQRSTAHWPSQTPSREA